MVKNILRIVFWNMALLLLAVVAVELVFGRWFEAFNRPNLWQLSIYRDVEWVLSAQGKYARDTTIRYTRDEFGLRSLHGSPESVEMLVLGGSTTDERFVGDGETWVDEFARCLKQAGTPLNIANAAVAGQSSRGHIRNFDVWLNHINGLRPRFVLVYLGINERLLEGRQSEDDVLAYNESRLPLWLERVRQKSAINALLVTIRGNLLALRAGVHHAAATQQAQLGSQRIDQAYAAMSGAAISVTSAEYQARLGQELANTAADKQAYAQRLSTLITKIRDFGAQPILVTQSAGTYRLADGVVSGDLAEYFRMAAINATTLASCRQHGIICLDLASQLSFGDGDFYDGVHTTPTASGKVGTAMCRAFRDAVKD